MTEATPKTIRKVVLDANVLYPAVMRDVLMHLAVRSLYLPVWSEEIHNEWMRNLLKDHPELGRERLERTKAKMLEYVPNIMITGFEALIPDLELPDLNDRHVLAAAIQAGAELIVTNNLKDFPVAALEPHGVGVIGAEAFVMTFAQSHPEQVLAALRAQRFNLKAPPVSVQMFLENLERNGLPLLVQWVKAQNARI
jgi:predicted nucleic acid-binding protein